MESRRAYWLAHLQAIEEEGIGTQAYAEREGLNVQSLYQWRSTLKADGSLILRARESTVQETPSRFIPVQVMATTSGCACTLMVKDYLRLECHELPSVSWLVQLALQLQERRG